MGHRSSKTFLRHSGSGETILVAVPPSIAKRERGGSLFSEAPEKSADLKTSPAAEKAVYSFYAGKAGLVMFKTTISSKGQIAIPKAMRERLNLKPGTELSIDVQGQALVLRRLVRNHPDWHTMRGMFRGGPDLLFDLIAERTAQIARDNDRI